MAGPESYVGFSFSLEIFNDQFINGIFLVFSLYVSGTKAVPCPGIDLFVVIYQ
jgi:hypothetical protein